MSRGLVGEGPRIGALLDPQLLGSMGEGVLAGLGLESWSLSFWEGLGDADLPALAEGLRSGLGLPATALSVFGNPLDAGETGARLRAALEDLIDAAPRFGATLVSCFAGRLPGRSVPDSVEAWKSVFGPLAERAVARGLSIAFECCRLGDTWKTGRWNIAINPDAWELLFAALPGAPLGLEWEPAHQVLALADPLAQLEAWAGRVLHVHAKDARIDRAALALHGVHGSTKVGRECLAGSGDSDWTAIFGILGRAGYRGTVDIEIGSTPGYEGERALEGIRLARAALFEARAALVEARAALVEARARAAPLIRP